MCLLIHTQVVCGTCGKLISSQSDEAWCADARKRGVFGRCRKGVSDQQGQSLGLECETCAAAREAKMSELEMEDFAENRLGWKGKRRRIDDGGEGGKGKGKGKGKEKEKVKEDEKMEDSDDGGGYGW
ncbi:hypothetical protein F4809DRAFT_640265 [Biscogniauxia mediterranea]|nr:hypothetical protein F4809DRAFT_640265 [Biscogniauxia mediterranea]